MPSHISQVNIPTICWHGSYSPGLSEKVHHHIVYKCAGCRRYEQHLNYGRCRSGRRWFWVVQRGFYDVAAEEYGWEDTEQAALDAVCAAIARFTKGQDACVRYAAFFASNKLKEINTAKRAARPPSDSTDSKSIEYLFSFHVFHSDNDSSASHHFYRFQIIKKTAKRIYYLDAAEEVDEVTGEPVDRDYPLASTVEYAKTGFVDRQKLEADGDVRNYGRHWSSDDFHLYASLQIARERNSPRDTEKEDIAALKAAMAAAHPDHGGSSEAFIEARQRYVDARRRARAA